MISHLPYTFGENGNSFDFLGLIRMTVWNSVCFAWSSHFCKPSYATMFAVSAAPASHSSLTTIKCTKTKNGKIDNSKKLGFSLPSSNFVVEVVLTGGILFATRIHPLYLTYCYLLAIFCLQRLHCNTMATLWQNGKCVWRDKENLAVLMSNWMSKCLQYCFCIPFFPIQ